MTKITASLVAIVMMFSLSVSAKFNDVETGTNYADAIERLSQYGIINGKDDGNFDPQGSLTRAEMSKISTVVAGLDGLAPVSSGTSLFSDMDGSYWASGYVNTAAKNKLIFGYPNGTFEPERELSFAEAVTIVLRLLGYSTDELGNNWPMAYMQKASELNLTTGINGDANDLINRANIALIIDRALVTDMKKANESAASKKLFALMNYTITDECIVLATNQQDKTLLSNEVKTTIGTYQSINNSANNYVTKKVKLVLNEDKKVVNAIGLTQTGKDIVIDSIAGTELAYTENGNKSSINLENTSVVYYQGNKTNIESVKPKIESGMTMVIYFSEGGQYDYAVIKDFDMIGPVVALSSVKDGDTSIGAISLTKSGINVIRDGYQANISDIKRFDVVYYNPISNTINVYCDKVSGVYEKAYPNKATVNKITLTGKDYSVGTQVAAYKLGENKTSYKLNDYMTLLIGKDGNIVDVVDLNGTDVSNYGIILGTRETISTDVDTKGKQETLLKVFTMNGNTQEFKTDKYYNDYRGKIIKLNIVNGLLVPNFITNHPITGKVDIANNSIGSNWLTRDSKIVELVFVPEKYTTGEAVAQLIELSQISQPELSTTNVIHAELNNNFGDIQFIVLDNVTQSKYSFGILTKKTGSKNTLDIGGVETECSGNFSPKEGQPVMAVIKGNSLEEMYSLLEITSYEKFEAVDAQRIKIGQKSYKIAPKATAYLIKDYKYIPVSLNELSNYTLKNIRIFADKAPADGGLIRIITFTQ